MSSINGSIITDSQGRRLTLRELGVLEESRLVRLVGADAENRVYMSGYVMPVVAVAAIDGEPCDLPLTARGLEAQISLIGNAGIKAVLEFLVAQNTAAAGGDAVKNS